MTYLTTGARGLLRPALDRCVEGGHYELERGAAAIAGGNPDPATKGTLHHEPAKVEPEAQAPLRAVASRRTGLLEQPVKAGRRQAGAMVGNCDLQPATRCRPRLHQHGFIGVLEGVSDQVGEDLSQMGRLASGSRK